MLLAQFAICAAIIIASGYRLTVCANEISEKTGFSAGLMGVIILAVITSCPELVTTLSSISFVDAPDLAIGDLLGADLFNILAIALLGVLCGKSTILRGQSKVNIFTAALAVVMLSVVIGSISFADIPLEILNIGLGSVLIGLLYLGGMAFICKHESNISKRKAGEGVAPHLVLTFVISAIIIIASGIWLANIGKNISIAYRLNEMYVGVLLIAFATTMPEFVVSLTALRQKSISMATGNLLGSNIFNIFIIFILDVFFRKGNFFSRVSNLNVFPAAFGILLTLIAIVFMVMKPTEKRILKFFSWDSLIIIALFIAGHYLLFNLAHGIKL